MNNYRLATQRPPHPDKLPEHASAPDASFLYVLATTGLFGAISYLWLLVTLGFSSKLSLKIKLAHGLIFLGSWFNNLWFYPFGLIFSSLLATDTGREKPSQG
jgi:hypothetical protein